MSSPKRSRPPGLVSPRGSSLGISTSQQFLKGGNSPFNAESQLKRHITESRKDLKNLLSEVNKVKQAEAEELGEIWNLVSQIKGEIGGFKRWNITQEKPQESLNRPEFGLLADQINMLKTQIKDIKDQTETKERQSWSSSGEEHVTFSNNRRIHSVQKKK